MLWSSAGTACCAAGRRPEGLGMIDAENAGAAECSEIKLDGGTEANSEN
jgi:hypothetical protein